jgi:hypothetical protein
MQTLRLPSPRTQTSLARAAAFLFVVAWAFPTSGNENFFRKPAAEWTENDALLVLNDSPWARTVTISTQDTPCSYKNPAFPGMFSEGEAEDATNPPTPVVTAKPDGAEYLVRWESSKQMQAAVQRLIALDDKWSQYGEKAMRWSEPGTPTDVERPRYSLRDMIMIAVILKHPGPDGASFLDYAFGDHGHKFPAKDLHTWPCSGLRSSDGMVFGRVASMWRGPQDPSALWIAFPRDAGGKPLVTHPEQKVEFRFVANQRVFETTFTISPSDLLSGTESVLYLPVVVTNLQSAPQQ